MMWRMIGLDLKELLDNEDYETIDDYVNENKSVMLAGFRHKVPEFRAISKFGSARLNTFKVGLSAKSKALFDIGSLYGTVTALNRIRSYQEEDEYLLEDLTNLGLLDKVSNGKYSLTDRGKRWEQIKDDVLW